MSENTNTIKTMLTYLEIEHKGVKVITKVDYMAKTVSFVEYDKQSNTYKDKKWLFAGRTRDYMGGWLNILSAIKEATTIADDLLKSREEADTEALAMLMYRVGKSMDEKDFPDGGKTNNA